MNQFNPESNFPPAVLATDLDGTLIPLEGSHSNEAALAALRNARLEKKLKLIYATGRHYESVLEAMQTWQLPVADWIVCDVGASIFHYNSDKVEYESFPLYSKHLEDITMGTDRRKVVTALEPVTGLQVQTADRQQRFKISYECTPEMLDKILVVINQILVDKELPFSAIGSVDPFEGCALIDVLPKNVSKAYALIWLSTHAEFCPDEVVYAGDSGNDTAALTSGFRAIVVGNASEGLATTVKAFMERRNLTGRLYFAKGNATTGVLEGCRHYGLI